MIKVEKRYIDERLPTKMYGTQCGIVVEILLVRHEQKIVTPARMNPVPTGIARSTVNERYLFTAPNLF